jgi:hypothetical protein
MAMVQSQEPSSKHRWFNAIAATKGTLCLAVALLFWDVANEGFYVFSLLVCPLWFLISIVKNLRRRPGWGTAALRVSLPLLTFGIAVSNATLQWRISDANAERIIEACDEFRVVTGRYPTELDELVPKYLTSVPRAKYCLMGSFFYVNSDGHCMLWWTRYGFYRRIYSFAEKRWSNLD